MKPSSAAERWEASVIKNVEGCWGWSGSRRPDGYGVIYDPDRKRQIGAHRIAWETVCGPIPRGKFVCHHCDNPPCTRPDHLFCGTPGQNVRDAMKKGRMRGRVKPNSAYGLCEDCRIRARTYYRMAQRRSRARRKALTAKEPA